MNPTADEIASAIAVAATLTGADLKKVAQGHLRGVQASEAIKARRLSVVALAGCWGHPAAYWAQKLEWASTEASAKFFLTRIRAGDLQNSPDLEPIARELGRTAQDCTSAFHQRKPGGRPRKARNEDEAIKALLKEVPAQRQAVEPNQRAKVTPKPPEPAETGGQVIIKRPSDPNRLARMKEQARMRPAPKPLTSTSNLAATSATPLETAFMSPAEVRAVQRCRALQMGGAGINDIRIALRNELGIKKSNDWIARACVTDLRDAA